MDDLVKSVADAVGSRADKFWKATLFASDRLVLGVNALSAGQEQAVHEHADQDKFYLVQEGLGLFTLGERTTEVGPDRAVWAPAGLPHGVRNPGPGRLVLIVGIAPGPRRGPASS
jgi:mannose-6-phosphate isomerase-like protein (cupin superfamily)